ncbi:MAG TPA: putative PEP-binding protein [Trebonia sp.]
MTPPDPASLPGRPASPARFRGVPVSAGRAVGVLRVADQSDNSNKPGSAAPLAATPEEVTEAFAAVARQRSALAERLRSAGRADEAGIIEVAALIATDPALSGPAADAVRGGADPAAAIREAAEQQARVMEKLDNPALAARAADIRQVGAAALDYLRTDSGASSASAGSSAAGAPGGNEPFILVRQEVGAAELIELADAAEASAAEGGGAGPVLAGAVSVAGGASSHAAIIARSLRLPMLAGADPAVLDIPSGQPAVLDADAGELTVGELTGDEPRSAGASAPAAASATAPPAGPVRTADGIEITVLCNVASAAETRRGLAVGAEGVGLLRTEILYLESADWPAYERQREHLAPILAQLAGKQAVVRLLDFSGDKIPPFLAGEAGTASLPAGAGLAALLGHPSALADQLRAILDAGGDAKLEILIPMVREPAEIARVREVLARVAADAGVPAPPVGIMVELAATARRAAEFARSADFFSIGTNDLTGDVLGLSRRDPAAGPALAADPRVLALVKQVADAGRDAGIEVAVCGDAAGDMRVLPLLLTAGIRMVSVGAGGVGTVRSAIGGLTTS